MQIYIEIKIQYERSSMGLIDNEILLHLLTKHIKVMDPGKPLFYFYRVAVT